MRSPVSTAMRSPVSTATRLPHVGHAPRSPPEMQPDTPPRLATIRRPTPLVLSIQTAAAARQIQDQQNGEDRDKDESRSVHLVLQSIQAVTTARQIQNQ